MLLGGGEVHWCAILSFQGPSPPQTWYIALKTSTHDSSPHHLLLTREVSYIEAYLALCHLLLAYKNIIFYTVGCIGGRITLTRFSH